MARPRSGVQRALLCTPPSSLGPKDLVPWEGWGPLEEALPRNCPHLKASTLALPSRNLMAGHLGVQLKADGPLSGFGVTKKASQLQLSHRVSQTPGETARQFNFSLCQEHTTEDSGFVSKETENSKVPEESNARVRSGKVEVGSQRNN